MTSAITPPEPDSSPAMQRILGALKKKPDMSVADISAEAFVGVTTLACGGYIAALKKRRLIYISGWRKVKGRFSTPLYRVGELDDVARPHVDDTQRDAPGMHLIAATLAHFGPLTYREIAEHSGLSRNTVKNSGFLDALIVQRRIHVSGWRRAAHGPMSPIYAYGPGEAQARPAPLTGAQKCGRHRERTRIATRGTGLSAQLDSLSAAIESSTTP